MVGENGDWRRAAGMLGPLARAGEQPDALLSPTWIRWTAAEAYRRAGQPDSAAALYELALSPEGLFWERRIEIRMLTPFAPRP